MTVEKILQEASRKIEEKLGIEIELFYKPKIRPLEEDIIESVCRSCNLTLKELKSSDRHKKILWPRQIAMYLLYHSGLTKVNTGKIFNRDHTIVIHSITNVNYMLSTEDGGFVEIYNKIMEDFGCKKIIIQEKGFKKVDAAGLLDLQIKKESFVRPPAEYSNHSPFNIAK